MSEFRKDPLTARWRIVAEGRLARPNKYAAPVPTASDSEDCPFCEGHEARTPAEVAAVRPKGSLPNGPGWTVRAIPNRYPTVTPDAHSGPSPNHGRFERALGSGVHEVIIEAPRHSPDLPYLHPMQLGVLFRFLRDRVRVATDRGGVAAVVLFENRGPESGGTLPHPHAQLIATETVPYRLEEELRGFRLPAESTTDRCRLESIVDAEVASGERIIASDSSFTTFAPFASEFPYEVWLVPKRHATTFAGSTDREVDRLAQLLPALLRTIDTIRPGASYNWIIHGLSGPSAAGAPFHWHVEVAPRLVRADGYDLGAGTPVNPVAPEAAATEIREKLVVEDRPDPQKP